MVLSSCALRGQGAAPQRPRIDPVGVEGEHPVVEVASCYGLAIQPIKITDISARRVDVAGAAIWFERPMAHDDGLRINRRDPIDGREPTLSACLVRLNK